MAVTVRPLTTEAERLVFIKLQWAFYRGDPYWVPPLIFDRKKLLDTKKNPFYKHGRIQLFLAERDGAPVGRIAAIVNDRHNEIHNDTVGFFGFFECIDDQPTADALFAAAAEWLRAQGKTRMRGPLNPSINDELGLLVDGYDDPPLILMTYNPRYYARLIEQAGFVKEKDLFAFAITSDGVVTPKLDRVQKAVRERQGVTIRNLDLKNVARELPIIKSLYNRAWEKNWGAVSMTDEEFDALAADLVQVMRNFEEFAFVLEKQGEPIGFALTLPNINEVLIHNKRGWLIPGALRLLTGTKKITKMRILVLGVLPEHREKGFDAVMYYEIVNRAMARGIHFGEASWVLEDNTMMVRAAKLMNAEAYKTYRIFEKAV